MKIGYITDDFSTLSGLASVAYGNTDLFREVQNQIINNSPTKTFDSQRPSDIFQSFLASKDYFFELITNSISNQYQENDLFADYIDEAFGADWLAKISGILSKEFFIEMDSNSQYGQDTKDFIFKAFNKLFLGYEDISSLVEEVTLSIISDPVLGPDISFITKIANNNPKNKISTPPSNTTIPLSQSIDLDKDYRGISFATGYISPQNYYSDIAYPGLEATSSTTPTTFKDSVLDGYVGYPTNISLESIFNPSGAESLRDISSAITSVLSGSDIWNSTSVLGDLANIPGLSQSDRDIYEISLIGPRINNLLTFDPATMSNGDYFDVSNLPKILNSDKEDGLPMSSRKFSNTF